MVEQDVDVLIIGGGLIGATLMLALAHVGFSTLLVEAKPFSNRVRPDFDARSLALSPASVHILKMLKIWPLIEDCATPIHTIHVSEQGGFGTTCLQGEAMDPLGYVVEMQHINRALHGLLDESSMITPAELVALDQVNSRATIRSEKGDLTLHARLIVAADGADSLVRHLCGLTANIMDYNQHAIVTNIGLARPHAQVAYERFTASGPLALLPMKGLRASLVWALKPMDAERLMASNESDFLKALQRAFGYRLGRFVKAGHRVLYPLRQVIMTQQAVGSIVFVGNAAHTLHPVAGQGFNLGLRDVAMLAQCIASNGLSAEMLQDYLKARRHDQTAIIHFTNGLIELFTSRLPGSAIARNTGLIALDHIPGLKTLLARYARGFAGVTPDLVCGIPLCLGEFA